MKTRKAIRSFPFWISLILAAAGPAFCEDLVEPLLSPNRYQQTDALKKIEALSQGQKKTLAGALGSALRRGPETAGRAAEALSKLGPDARPAAADLVEALRYDDEAIYVPAADALVHAGPEASVGLLEKDLADPNFFVRRRSAEILGRFGPAARHAAPELARRLLDSHYEVQAAAQNALVQMGEAALPALTRLLERSDEDTRKIVLAELGRFGLPAAPVLIKTLKKDESSALRAAAAELLGALKSPPPAAAQALLEALADLEEAVRVAAADALGRMPPAAKPAIGALIVMSHNDSDALVRQRASQALEQIGPADQTSLPGFIQGLKAGDADVNQDIARTIARSTIALPDALPVLEILLKEGDVPARVLGVQAAAALDPHPGAALPLFASAIKDPAPQVRSAAIGELGRLTGSAAQAARALALALNDPNPAIRQQVIESLSHLGTAGLPGLIQELSDSFGVLADQSERAIIGIGPDAAPWVEPLEQSSDPALRKTAARILRRIAQKHSR